MCATSLIHIKQKNAIYFFAIDYKKRWEAMNRTRVRYNLVDVVTHVIPLWQEMNDGQRRPYVRQAKAEREDQLNLDRYGTLVRRVTDIEEMIHEEANKVIRTKQLFEERVRGAWFMRAGFEYEDFYFISMQHFCHTFERTYLPAELGIVKYSLKRGVQDQLHILINPGTITLCDVYEAMLHSERTHKLPIPPDALGMSDYHEIADQILTFTTAYKKAPLLLTDTDSVPRVESMLRDIVDNHIDGNKVHVFSLAELFVKYTQVAARTNASVSAVPSAPKAQEILDDDAVFNNAQSITCEYHESRDLHVHCALSQCVRWAHTISNYCCPQIPETCDDRTDESGIDGMGKKQATDTLAEQYSLENESTKKEEDGQDLQTTSDYCLKGGLNPIKRAKAILRPLPSGPVELPSSRMSNTSLVQQPKRCEDTHNDGEPGLDSGIASQTTKNEPKQKPMNALLIHIERYRKMLAQKKTMNGT